MKFKCEFTEQQAQGDSLVIQNSSSKMPSMKEKVSEETMIQQQQQICSNDSQLEEKDLTYISLVQQQHLSIDDFDLTEESNSKAVKCNGSSQGETVPNKSDAPLNCTNISSQLAQSLKFSSVFCKNEPKCIAPDPSGLGVYVVDHDDNLSFIRYHDSKSLEETETGDSIQLNLGCGRNATESDCSKSNAAIRSICISAHNYLNSVENRTCFIARTDGIFMFTISLLDLLNEKSKCLSIQNLLRIANHTYIANDICLGVFKARECLFFADMISTPEESLKLIFIDKIQHSCFVSDDFKENEVLIDSYDCEVMILKPVSTCGSKIDTSVSKLYFEHKSNVLIILDDIDSSLKIIDLDFTEETSTCDVVKQRRPSDFELFVKPSLEVARLRRSICSAGELLTKKEPLELNSLECPCHTLYVDLFAKPQLVEIAHLKSSGNYVLFFTEEKRAHFKMLGFQMCRGLKHELQFKMKSLKQITFPTECNLPDRSLQYVDLSFDHTLTTLLIALKSSQYFWKVKFPSAYSTLLVAPKKPLQIKRLPYEELETDRNRLMEENHALKKELENMKLIMEAGNRRSKICFTLEEITKQFEDSYCHCDKMKEVFDDWKFQLGSINAELTKHLMGKKLQNNKCLMYDPAMDNFIESQRNLLRKFTKFTEEESKKILHSDKGSNISDIIVEYDTLNPDKQGTMEFKLEVENASKMLHKSKKFTNGIFLENISVFGDKCVGILRSYTIQPFQKFQHSKEEYQSMLQFRRRELTEMETYWKQISHDPTASIEGLTILEEMLQCQQQIVSLHDKMSKYSNEGVQYIQKKFDKARIQLGHLTTRYKLLNSEAQEYVKVIKSHPFELETEIEDGFDISQVETDINNLLKADSMSRVSIVERFEYLLKEDFLRQMNFVTQLRNLHRKMDRLKTQRHRSKEVSEVAASSIKQFEEVNTSVSSITSKIVNAISIAESELRIEYTTSSSSALQNKTLELEKYYTFLEIYAAEAPKITNQLEEQQRELQAQVANFENLQSAAVLKGDKDCADQLLRQILNLRSEVNLLTKKIQQIKLKRDILSQITFHG